MVKKNYLKTIKNLEYVLRFMGAFCSRTWVWPDVMIVLKGLVNSIDTFPNFWQ